MRKRDVRLFRGERFDLIINVIINFARFEGFFSVVMTSLLSPPLNWSIKRLRSESCRNMKEAGVYQCALNDNNKCNIITIEGGRLNDIV